VDRVGGVPALVQDAVLPQPAWGAPSGSNMARIMVGPTGLVSAAVCWLTSKCGLRQPGQRWCR